MVKFKCPQDCPDRCPTCHIDCKHGYVEFREKRNKELEKKYKDNEDRYSHRQRRYYMKKDSEGNCIYAVKRVSSNGKRKKV